jgi:hypothetical protein
LFVVDLDDVHGILEFGVGDVPVGQRVEAVVVSVLFGEDAEGTGFVEKVLGEDEEGRGEHGGEEDVSRAHPANGKDDDFTSDVVPDESLLGVGKFDGDVL